MSLALITGGTRGIGLAIAHALGKGGFDLLLSYHENHEAAEAARQGLHSQYGVRVEVAAGDVKSEATRAELFRVVDEAFPGPLTAFVQNAGYAIPASLPGGFSLDQYDEAQELAPKAFLRCVEQAIARMPDGAGRIVAISSLGVHEPSSVYAMMAPAKAALEVLVKHYALALAPRGITVNTVVPGYIQTDAWAGFAESIPYVLDMPPKVTPAGRWGQPDDVAPLVAFLCSEPSRFITGQRICVDGGVSLSLLRNLPLAARAAEGE